MLFRGYFLNLIKKLLCFNILQRNVQYQQPGKQGEFNHGLFDCCDSCTDCLLAYLCPNCYAFCAAQQADEGLVRAVLNCLFYPLCLCCMRSNVREKRGIEGI